MDYSKQKENEHGLVFDIGSLYAYLEQIEDRRQAKGRRYKLIDLLVLMLLAKLGGEDTPSGMAEWISHRKESWVACQIIDKPKTASHMTYRRVLQEIISTEDFEKILQEYHRSRLKIEKEIIITVDGKQCEARSPTEHAGVLIC